MTEGSPARSRTDNKKRLLAIHHGIGQGRVRSLVGKILLAREEPDERASLFRPVVANRPAQDGIGRLNRIQHRAKRRRPAHLHLHFVITDACERPEVRREYDSNHDNVCTSTETTDGKF